MERKAKILVEEKLRAVEDYLCGRRSTAEICIELQIRKSSFQLWLRKYQLQGYQGLQTAVKNKYYSEIIKAQAVSDYMKGSGSLNQICTQYNISTHSILRQWIKKYNDHEMSKSHNAQEDKHMIKGRKTTYEERIEIVAFCVANNDNYHLTSEQFQVSYQQIYSWIKKYKKQGCEALFDRRGLHKSFEELTESEKFAAQLNLLEAENRRLKMENDFLKKLDELERRGAVTELAKNINIKQ